MTVTVTNGMKSVVHKGKLAAGSGHTCVLSLHGLSVCTEGVLSCSDWTPSKSTHPGRWCQQQPTCDQSFLAASKHTKFSAWVAAFASHCFTAAAATKSNAASKLQNAQADVDTHAVHAAANVAAQSSRKRHKHKMPG